MEYIITAYFNFTPFIKTIYRIAIYYRQHIMFWIVGLFLLYSSGLSYNVPHPLNSFTKHVQYGIIHPLYSSPLYVRTEWYDSKLPFLFSKPFIHTDNTIYIRGFLEKRWRYNRAPVLWLKMKNQQAYKNHDERTICIDDVIHDTYDPAIKKNRHYGPPKSARDFNRELWNFYSTHHSELQNKKVNVSFLPDTMYSKKNQIGFSWATQDLRIEYSNNQLYIQSPVLYKEYDDTSPSRYSGMYYMKLLTPELIMFLLEKYSK